MSETIVAAIIGLGGALVGSLLTMLAAYVKSHYVGIKLSRYKDVKGKFILPSPFPCASCEYKYVASLVKGQGLEFFFDQRQKVDFVSLVYPFNPPVNLRKLSSLEIEVEFHCDTLLKIEVEIVNRNLSHPENADRFIAYTVERPNKGSVVYINTPIDGSLLKSNAKILKCVHEINFVIRPLVQESTTLKDGYFAKGTDIKTTKGSFIIKELNINEK